MLATMCLLQPTYLKEPSKLHISTETVSALTEFTAQSLEGHTVKNLVFQATVKINEDKDHNTAHTLRLQLVKKYVCVFKKKTTYNHSQNKNISVFCSFRKKNKLILTVLSETCSEKPQFSKLFLTGFF